MTETLAVEEDTEYGANYIGYVKKDIPDLIPPKFQASCIMKEVSPKGCQS